MSSIILKKFSEPESLTNKKEATPLSYKEWIAQNYGISENSESDQYQKYLLSWYEQRGNSNSKELLKQHYKDLLKKLSVVFRNDEEFRKISTLNLDDDKQLKLALPYYVKKIKEIALYYKDKRESIKRAKLKYNMVGSFNAVEKTFYEHILKAFSKKDYTLNIPSQESWNMFPELSSVNTGFSIKIEEIYDDTDYYQEGVGYSYKAVSDNPLTYILDDILEQEYGTTDINQIPLSGFQVPLDVEHTTDDINFYTMAIANEKYAGADKYLLKGGHFIDDLRHVSLQISQGDNFFYWFSGEYFREAPNLQYLPIPINDLDWIESGATAGDTLEESDRIFVNYDGQVKGAWLSRIDDIVVEDTLSVNLKDGKTFRYPYPGIGISAEGLEWTGMQVKEYEFYNKAFFPDQTQKNKVLAQLEELYWTQTESNSSVVPISIHDTSLIDSGAYAHKKFHLADQIITRSDTIDGVHDGSSNGVYNGKLNVEWLYDFTTTQIPISAGENRIFWPYQAYSDDTEIILNKSDIDTIALSEIPIDKFSGAIAGNAPEVSDMIFKMTSKCGEVVEAAWLCGHPLSAMYNECTYSKGELVVQPTSVIPEQIPFSPWRISTLKHWWMIENVSAQKTRIRHKSGVVNYPNLVNRWTDVVSNNVITVDNKNDKPRYDGDLKRIRLNSTPRDYVESEGLEGLYWNVSNPIATPYTICMAFRTQKKNNIHTLIETDTKDKKDLKIVIRDTGVLSVSTFDGKNRIAASNRVNPNAWYYIIVVVNGNNSKLILNGTEFRGKLDSVSLRKLLIGMGRRDAKKRVREFQGDIRDIIVFNSALSVDEINSMKSYMGNLIQTRPSRPSVTPEQIVYDKINTNLVLKELAVNIENTATTGDFLSGSMQPGLAFKAEARTFTRFIFTGTGNLYDSVNINDKDYYAFHGHHHDETCPYKNLSASERVPITSSLSDGDQWKRCNCNAILYSPMGHTGETFRDGSTIGDFIMLDTSYPDTVGLDEWRGSDGLGWQDSKDFAWFKLDEGQPDGTHGWGKGRWVTNYGEDFEMVSGKAYIYYRSGFNVSCENMNGDGASEPFLIINQPICDCSYINCQCDPSISCLAEWRRAKLVNGVWEDQGSISKMTLEPLGHYIYLHRDKQKFSTIIGEDEEYIDCNPSVNFLLSIDLPSASPYWAKGSFENGSITLNKSMMYGGENLGLVYDYLQVTQPAPSTLILRDGMYFEYKRNSQCSTDCFVWHEPLKFKVKKPRIAWKKIEVDRCVESDILHYILKTGCVECERLQKKCSSCCAKDEECACELDKCVTTKVGISATNEDSDIVLHTMYNGAPVFVNYYSIGNFTLEFDVINIENGIAPTGGLWVDEELVDFTSPRSPWTNIPNIFGTNIALKMNQSGLYTATDCGFFKPSKTGYTVVKLNNKVIELTDPETRSLSSVDIVLDPEHYMSHPYKVTYVNSEWMKNKTNCSGGNIKNAVDNQEFSPYQSFYESTRQNIFGIQRQDDLITPWVGDKKDKVFDPRQVNSSIQGVPNVYCGPDSWFANQPEISGTMYEWKMDVYGNQYGLYKDLDTAVTIKSKLETTGKLWIRTSIDKIGDVATILPRVIDSNINNALLVNELVGVGIVSIDVIYDTLIIRTLNYVLFVKINIDYTTGDIFSNEGESFIFEAGLEDFGGTWLDEENKDLYFVVYSGAFPKIYKLSLNNSKLRLLYDEQPSEFNFKLGASNVSNPLFSYNPDRNFFNIAFHGIDVTIPYLLFWNFRMSETANKLELGESVKVPLYDLGNKTLIKTSLFEDKMLLIFEEEVDGANQIYQVSIDNKY